MLHTKTLNFCPGFGKSVMSNPQSKEHPKKIYDRGASYIHQKVKYLSGIYISDWFTFLQMLYLQQFPAAVTPKIHKNVLHLFSSLPYIIKVLNRNLKHFALFLGGEKNHNNEKIKKKLKQKKKRKNRKRTKKGTKYLNTCTCI